MDPKHPGVIGRIVFAVPRAHAAAFDAAFGEPKVEEIAPVAADEDEEDDFDLRISSCPKAYAALEQRSLQEE